MASVLAAEATAEILEAMHLAWPFRVFPSKAGGTKLFTAWHEPPWTTSPGRGIAFGEAVPLRDAALSLSTNTHSSWGGVHWPQRGVWVEHPNIHCRV